MSTARLMFAESGHDADMLYASGFYAHDPFLWWEVRGQTCLALSPLEIDRARPIARVDHLHAIEDFFPEKSADRSVAAQIVALAKKYRIKKFLVPSQFPSGLWQQLQARKLTVTVQEKPFFPQRLVKTSQETVALEQALRVAETGLRRGVEVLQRSRPDKKGVLHWCGHPLTSERLRAEMDGAVLLAGGEPAQTIVAGGEQGCDPHERGTGSLYAHQAIVLDIFPRHAQNHYFGDLTRTIVRGRASEALRKQYATVKSGKKWVMRQMRAGADGAALQKELLARFTRAGYPTEKKEGRWVGMFHGVGHGLGLELHEAPRFAGGKLFRGQVTTVEPGLYYPGVGGVRLEDVVVVGPSGIRNLTRFEEELELR